MLHTAPLAAAWVSCCVEGQIGNWRSCCCLVSKPSKRESGANSEASHWHEMFMLIFLERSTLHFQMLNSSVLQFVSQMPTDASATPSFECNLNLCTIMSRGRIYCSCPDFGTSEVLGKCDKNHPVVARRFCNNFLTVSL